MQIDPSTVVTREVLEWEGLHLLNFSQSSCSQKVRILLAEKNVDYTSHEINLKSGDQTTPWYLGINPRGVVPVLIHDGAIHVESNDLLEYIDEQFPSEGFSWLPTDSASLATVDQLLTLEDELHIHLRVITMGFLLPRVVARKSEKELEAYANNGVDDPYRTKQIEWWRNFGRQGVTHEQALEAVSAFHKAFSKLDELVSDQVWLLGDKPSVLDIAWFITLHRADLAGYPLIEHPDLHRVYGQMCSRPAFQQELKKGPAIVHFIGPLYRFIRKTRGTTLRYYFDRWKKSTTRSSNGSDAASDAGAANDLVGSPRNSL